jgi:hypothetical protein
MAFSAREQVDRALRARFFSPEIAERHHDPPCDQSLKPFGNSSRNFAPQPVAEGPEHQGEQAERGDVGRGFGDGGDGEGAAVPV